MSEWDTEEYLASTSPVLAQEMFDKGIIYAANRMIHMWGYAIGVTVDKDDTVIGLNLHRTDDPDGIWFAEEDEVGGRRKLFGR